MNNKNLTIGLVIAIIIAVGGYLFPQVKLGVTGVLGALGTRFPNGLSADTTSPVAGQLRGTTLTVTGTSTLPGGVDISATSSSFSSTQPASLVACSIRNPFTSTSTLLSYLINITTATSTGGTIIGDFGIDPTATATTTIINGGNSIAQGAQAAFSATSSPMVPPLYYVNFKTNPAFAGTTFGAIYGGTCSGVFAQP